MLFPTLALIPQEAQVWYGPATATFPVQFSGDPFDPAENDVEVRFTTKSGEIEKRLAFFNPTIGSWQAILVAHDRGEYKAVLARNGKTIPLKAKEGTIKLMSPLPHGFLRYPKSLVWDDGTPFSPQFPTIPVARSAQYRSQIEPSNEIEKLPSQGVNSTKVFAWKQEGLNPWDPSDGTKLLGRALWGPALDRWSRVEQSASASGVELTFILLPLDEFAQRFVRVADQPHWEQNGWNVKNGGFLQKPEDLVTDEEAKCRTKIWIRYVVARYSASPALFEWRLIEEFGRHLENFALWSTWDKEMSEYLTSIDPYHHPVGMVSSL